MSNRLRALGLLPKGERDPGKMAEGQMAVAVGLLNGNGPKRSLRVPARRQRQHTWRIDGEPPRQPIGLVCQVIGSTFRRGVHLARSDNAPMKAARFRAGIPNNGPRAVSRVHHQMGARANSPPYKQIDYVRNGGLGFARFRSRCCSACGSNLPRQPALACVDHRVVSHAARSCVILPPGSTAKGTNSP